jgi:hypothetical protein
MAGVPWMVVALAGQAWFCIALAVRLRRGVDARSIILALALLPASICLTSLLLGLGGFFTSVPLLVISVALGFTGVLLRPPFRPAVRADDITRVRRDGIGWYWHVIAGLGLAWTAWVVLGIVASAARVPSLAYDALFYHLPAAASWVQAHRVYFIPSDNVWLNVYPMNTELLFAYLMVFTHTAMPANFVQVYFVLLGGLAVMLIATDLGARWPIAVLAGCLFVMTPQMLLQARQEYVDDAAATWILMVGYAAYWVGAEDAVDAWVFYAVCAGMLFGTKADGAAFDVFSLIPLIAGRWPLNRSTLKRLAIGIGCVVTGCILMGGYWYGRNMAAYGNPLYPFTIAFAGHVIFSGRGSVQDLIMQPNTPKAYLPLPDWRRVVLSWLGSGRYWLDGRRAGMGATWLWLGWPSLIACMVLYWLRPAASKRMVVLALIGFGCLSFLIQPANWWARYTVWLAGFGAFCFALLLDELVRLDTRPAKLLALILGVLVLVCIRVDYVEALPGLEYGQSAVAALGDTPTTQARAVSQDQFAWTWSRNVLGHVVAYAGGPAYLYLLFGPDLMDRVVYAGGRTERTLRRAACGAHAVAFATSPGSFENTLAAREPGWTVIERGTLVNAYRVQCS